MLLENIISYCKIPYHACYWLTFLKFLYTELATGLSGVILPVNIWDIIFPRVTIPITDLIARKWIQNESSLVYPRNPFWYEVWRKLCDVTIISWVHFKLGFIFQTLKPKVSKEKIQTILTSFISRICCQTKSVWCKLDSMYSVPTNFE